ncbi:MAG: pantothenate kinase [Firmicutes bacterium]|nr:pantothenate kinase [Bacillota bacterium]
MNTIGIDLGISLFKIVECDDKLNIIHKMSFSRKDMEKDLDEFININNINLNNVEKIVITGVYSLQINLEKIKGIPVIKTEEFLSIAKGGMNLANKKEGIIISIGTGTAFIRAKGGSITHIGGTGIGGGVLLNLCRRFTEAESFDEIVELASKGDISKVDLTIGDITKEKIPNLPADITAVNFGKLSKGAGEADIALGIINMIFETVGMMAVFAAKEDSVKDIILAGSLTKIPYIKTVFERFKWICDLNFIIPENAEYCAAIGAIAWANENNKKEK